MNIVMFTNDYEPVVGGVSRSISTFSEDLRQLGHRVMIVTLVFPGAEESEEQVVRLPSVKEVSGTQFSLKLPIPAGLSDRLDAFAPDIVHSHHPFMLGDTALRVARKRQIPIVFTHHTLYERYTYLFSRESEVLPRIAQAVATEYANLCNRVVAPTQSIKDIIRRRGVQVSIDVIPSGIDATLFGGGDGEGFRRQHEIPRDAFVLGYLGRVVEAKNMNFLADVASRFLTAHSDAWYLVVGEGESVSPLKAKLERAGVAERLVLTGSLNGKPVADAYAAMDVFAFASKTETQGIVLAESLCAGTPVVALDASGSRDVLQDGKSGILLAADADAETMADAIEHLREDSELLDRLMEGARARAQRFDRTRCAEDLASLYGQLDKNKPPADAVTEVELWPALQCRFAAEWDLFTAKLNTIAAALTEEQGPE